MDPRFESLYQDVIIPRLEAAEKIRRKIVLNYSIIGTVALAGFIFEAMTWMAIGVAVIILFIILYTRWYSIPVSKFTTLYEDAIIRSVIENADPSLVFDRNSHLSLNELKNGLIISGTPQFFGGNFLINGISDGIPIRISEIHSSTKKMHRSGNEKLHYDFNGLVAVSALESRITEPILICTDYLIRRDLSNLSDKMKIELQDDNDFSVYAGNESEFEKFVSPQLLDNLRQFAKNTKNDIIFSVTSEGIHLAIPKLNAEKYLNPTVFKSSFTKNEASVFYRDILFLTENIRIAADRIAAVAV